jgi:hypothetical protein
MATEALSLENQPAQHAPPVVWALSLLCILPFVVASIIFCYGPQTFAHSSLAVLFAYSTAMLGYMGGVRAGIEIERHRPRLLHLAVSVVAPMIGFGLLLAQGRIPAPWRLGGFIIAIVLQWLWDVSIHEGPPWRSRMRTFVTAGAGIPLAFALEQALHL